MKRVRPNEAQPNFNLWPTYNVIQEYKNHYVLKNDWGAEVHVNKRDFFEAYEGDEQ